MAKNEKEWRLRLRIYDSSGTLVADTHPDLGENASVNRDETTVGIVPMLERVSAIIHDFHGAPPDTMEGARTADLVKRVPSIRVYMSQHAGRCAVRVPYTPDNATSWKALATIQRDDWRGPEEQAQEARPSLRQG